MNRKFHIVPPTWHVSLNSWLQSFFAPTFGVFCCWWSRRFKCVNWVVSRDKMYIDGQTLSPRYKNTYIEWCESTDNQAAEPIPWISFKLFSLELFSFSTCQSENTIWHKHFCASLVGTFIMQFSVMTRENSNLEWKWPNQLEKLSESNRIHKQNFSLKLVLCIQAGSVFQNWLYGS